MRLDADYKRKLSFNTNMSFKNYLKLRISLISVTANML